MARKALVTGGNRGIGLAIADLLKRDGHEVATPARDELDLGSASSIHDYFADPKNHVDILVNNAGMNKVSPLESLQLEDWRATLETNLTAPFLLIQALSGGMKQRRWGRIVNVSSCYSQVSRAGRAAYTSSKAGLNGLTRAAAVELAPHHVLVNAICPGFVETDMTRQNNNAAQIEALCAQVPLGRLAQPHEIAELVAFLVSERNTYITGECISIDGGFLLQ